MAKPADVYLGLRQLAFGEESPGDVQALTAGTVDQLLDRASRADSSFEQMAIWRELRQRGHQPSPQQASKVLVTVCEFTLGGTPVTLAAHSSGDASLYLGTGGGVIGGGGNENVRRSAAALCIAVESIASILSPMTTPPNPPAVGEFVVSVVQPSGTRAARYAENAVRSKSHPLFPTYDAMHDVITQIRRVEQGGAGRSWENAGAYGNCLLTLMAENGSGDVTVIAGEPLPELQALARTPEQRQWISKACPDGIESIDSRIVMKLLKRGCRFGWFRQKGSFPSKLARDDGTFLDVVFEVERGKNAAGRKMLRFRLGA